MVMSQMLLLLSLVILAFGEQQHFMDGPKYQEFNLPTIADLLTVERSTSIFYSYVRETKFSKMLDGSYQNLTILAPTNKAVIALPRKP